MSVYVVKRGEIGLSLSVPVQFDRSEPTPTPSAAKMILKNTTTRKILERNMRVEDGPAGLIYLVYDWLQADWDGPDFPFGRYHAQWEMTQDGKRTVAPSRGYDKLIIEDVRAVLGGGD